MKQSIRVALALSLAATAASSATAQSQPTFTIEGSPGDALGRDVAVLGDLDGDGFPEIVASATSSIELFSGRDGRRLLSLTVGGLYRAFEPIGDFDGDGIADLALGRTSMLSYVPVSGGLDILSGAWLAWLADPAGPAPLAGFYSTTTIGAGLGKAISVVGDIDGDGRAELAIGASLGAATGGTYVASGTDFSQLGFYPMTLSGIAIDDEICSAGDVNLDDVPDLLLGASGGFSGAGVVTVVSGKDGSTLWRASGQAHAATGSHPATEDRLGSSLVRVDDLNGDQVSEIAVGAVQYGSSGASGKGYVSVLNGATGRELYRIDGDASGDGFGSDLALLPDLNGDGIRDLAAGASAGSAGYVRILSGADGSTLQTLSAGTQALGFGTSVEFARDINGDGQLDILISAPGEGPAGAGRIYVFSVNPAPAEPAEPARRNPGVALRSHI